MRSGTPRMLAAAAAATSLALIPAGAAAARVRQPHVSKRVASVLGCRVSMFAEPHLVTTGESAQLFGGVSCPSLASAISQPVSIYQRIAGTPGFKLIDTTTSMAGGFYSFIVPSLTANSVFYAVSGTRRSASRPIRVAPVVTLNGPTQSAALLTGARNAITFSGTVTPDEEGTGIALQREASTSNEEWGTIQFGTVGAKGVYSIKHRFALPGDANLRVLVKARPHTTVRGLSNTLSYVISQPQNPALTINSSAQVAPYGQTIKITGVMANAKDQKVMLMSHPRNQPPFTKVDEATTNSSGEYSFSESALRNGPYRVLGPTNVGSSVLYEGVRYVLSASAAPASVPAGQAVTFSGTVTPIHAGHVVYVERENPGGGFHVVDVGTVSPTGTYSISHYVFGTGKQVFRVHVPGDPENMGVSSQTFPVEVTAPAPGSLRPVAPAKQPLEGKV